MTSDARWKLSLVSGCAAAVLLLAGCSKRTAQETAPAAAQQPARHGTFNARMMQGADQAAIRSYLQSVHEVKPKKFEVQWSARHRAGEPGRSAALVARRQPRREFLQLRFLGTGSAEAAAGAHRLDLGPRDRAH